MDTVGRGYRSAPAKGASRARRGLSWRVAAGFLFLLAPALLASAHLESRYAGAQDLVLPMKTLAVSLPLHQNARVDRWVQRFRTDQRAAFERLLERQGAYDAMIRKKLQQRGMPQELLYLAMMESGLSPRAESSASAVGLWQFMTPTAQQYGLRVDEWVDERRDPVRATNAALEYLSYLHDRYGSWYLAAAAYNAGPGTVDRVLARHADGRSGDEDLYWEVLDHLPRETRDYVPRLVAATLLAEDVQGEGFDVQSERPYRYDRVFVPAGTSLATVAWRLDVQPRVLRNLNPHLIQGVTPPDQTYPIRVPVGLSPGVVATVGRRGKVRRAND
jgi:membrane-bound lytic murein transglycosylase D